MTPLAWAFLTLAVLSLTFLVIALGALDEARAENHRLRTLIHPSTRRTRR